MRRWLVFLFLAACGASQTPAAAPDGTTTVSTSQDPAAASASAAPRKHKHKTPIGSAWAAGAEPTTLEGAVHFEVEPIADKCYDDRAAGDPSFGGGMVNVRVIVPATGPVKATDLGSTLKDQSTIDCIIAAFSHLTWRPADGKEVDSTIPFSFIKASD